MKWICCSLLLLVSTLSYGQSKDEKLIRQLLTVQTQAWNKGDIEGFMQTYWKNDSLMFIGSNGVNWGWKTTLDHYKKAYPDTAAMGKLSFDIILVKQLSPEYYFVVGKWMLNRSIGDLSGHYNLLMRKIKGRWFIVSDHSS